MKYTIKKGQQSWHPRPIFPIVLTDFERLTWTVTAHESMQFDYIDPETGLLDADWEDWKKAGGVSLVNWRNPQNIVIKNRDAIMLTLRYNPTLPAHVFEYAVYVNDRGGRKVYERPDQVLRTTAGTRVSMQLTRNNRRSYNAALYLTSKGVESVNAFTIETRQRFTAYSLINSWYGGKNNAPGRWGGAAPKDMEMDIEFEKH